MSATIDLASIKAGGKISLTLKDGTKIIDSLLDVRGGSLFCAGSCKRVLDLSNPATSVSPNIATIDAYTPPKPAWATDLDVFAVLDMDEDIWGRSRFGWTCVTYGTSDRYKDIPSEELERRYGPLKVYAKVVKG